MKPYRILVTGSRFWNDTDAIEQSFDALEIPEGASVVLVHGGARGLDTLADAAALLRGWYAESYPVFDEDWIQYGKAAGPRRNRMMVDSDVDLCLGFPLNLTAWSGTLGCMTMADMAGVPVFVDNGRTRWYASDEQKARITI